ncbi:MAG: ABC transporter transmembrane domain-containing protein [Bacteroidota bacterium]
MAKRREQLKDSEKRSLNKSNFKKLLGIFRFIVPYKTRFIMGMICLIFGSVILLSFPYLAGKLVDVASGKLWLLGTINQLTIALIAVLLIQSVFSFLRVYLFAQVSERSMADVRKAVFSNILLLPLSFFDARRVGELTSRITSDVSMLQDTFSTTLAEVFRQLATLVIGTAIIFFITPKLTLFMLCTFPVLVIAALVFGKYIRKLSKKTQDNLAQANVIVEETLQTISVVKAFTNEKLETFRYARSLNHVIDVALKTATFRGAFISFIILALFGGIVGVMWYGAILVQSGALTVGDLLSFILYTTFIGGSIAGLGDIYGQLQRAIGASERVLEIIDEAHESGLVEEEELPLNGDIRFTNVSFSYPSRPEVSVLNSIALSIPSGQKLALVGPSGAGKSTIVQLLMRYYHYTHGRITVGDKNIEDYNLYNFRKQIGIVPQEVILFGGSIYDNIIYGKPNATREAALEAAKKANASEFIESFPNGYDTLVGERGIKLSGGQRQRIAIARAILKDPKILILDEATSALDTESEMLVQSAIEELMKNRTTIIIAHRLATIRKADKIAVIQKGTIAEVGAHDELTSNEQGIYNHLLKLQFQVA